LNEDMTEVRFWSLKNVITGNKYYEVWTWGRNTLLAWGRIGTEGQCSLKIYDNDAEARAKALAQVYAKQTKGGDKSYIVEHDDLVIQVPMDPLRSGEVVSYLRRITHLAINSGEATTREAALNYIEGFISDCNEYMVRAKRGLDTSDLEAGFEDLTVRWEELKDKFDSAETMMKMVTMRALNRA
jgi:predicted DNA-binding WGR domain protein